MSWKDMTEFDYDQLTPAEQDLYSYGFNCGSKAAWEQARAEATGPERDLAEQALEKLEWLARQGNDPVWKGVQVNYCPVTEEFTYFGPAMLDSDLTRAEALELLRERRCGDEREG